MLEVRFLEVFRQAERDLGVNLFAGNARGNRVANTGLGPTGPDSGITGAGRFRANADGSPLVDAKGNPVATPGSLPLLGTAGTLASGAVPFGSLLGTILRNSNGQTIDILVTALEEKGLVRRLAEPNLIALSGDAARFLAGGEFPVPIPNTTTNGFPTVTIEYKKFEIGRAHV